MAAPDPAKRLSRARAPLLLSLAIPDKGGRILVPTGDGFFQPVNDLLLRLRVLPRKGASDQNALHRLCHIQPGTPKWRVERHDAMLKKPGDHLVAPVAC